MARGTIRDLTTARTQQWSLAVRTEQPAETEEGDAWIRSDIAPDEGQIGAIEVATGGTTDTVPIYDPDQVSFGPDVAPVRGVRVNGTTGVVPVAGPADATGPPLRVNRAGTVYQAHSATEIGAIPDSVVDNFEESLYEDQGKTLSDYYSGDLGAFARQTSTVLEGSNSLEYSGSATSYILSGSFSASSGTTYRWDVRTESGSNSGPYGIFGNPDATTFSGYMAGINPNKDNIHIYRVDSGSFTELASASATISTSTRYINEFQWGSSGDLVYRLLDGSETELGATSVVSDTNYTSGAIGWRYYNADGVSQNAYFDHMRSV